MKKSIVIFFLLLMFKVSSYTQVLDLTNVKREITPNKYNGSYCFIPPNLKQEDYAGLVGEEMIILDSMFYLFKGISYKNYAEPFIIKEYLAGDELSNGSFKLGLNSEMFYLDLDEIEQEAYLKKGLAYIKDSFIGKKLFFTHNPIHGLDGKKYDLSSSKVKFFTVHDAKIANVKHFGLHQYVPVLIFENGLILELIENSYDNNYKFRDDDGNSFEYYLSGSIGGVVGRRVIKRNISGILKANIKSGKTVMKICIDRSGNVSNVELIESTTTNKKKVKKLLKAAMGYKYEPDPNAPEIQCGKLTIVSDIRALKGF